MKLEYHTRDNVGKYKKHKDVENIYFEEDGRFCYINLEFLDGKRKRYLLIEI